MRQLLALAALAVLLCVPKAGIGAPIPVVSAESVYGDVARQIGGPDVAVTSILSNPDQDPHLFEAPPSVARAVSAAPIVILNGLDYDPWMERLLAASRSGTRRTLVVGALAGRKRGDNPHVWFDTRAMLALGAALADALGAADPAAAPRFRTRLKAFQDSMGPIQARIATMRERLAGTDVTATEPVSGALFDALGMNSRNPSFQRAIMNNAEPSASEVAAFEDDLKQRRVKLLLYNSQASDPVAARMRKLAERSQVPVVAAMETEPPGQTYQAWMTGALDAIDRALPRTP